MNFQKMIRIQMMLMGMGAGLLLARPVCAQQDMDPDHFDDSTNTVAMDQALNAMPSAEAAKVAAADSQFPLAVQVDAAELTPVDGPAVVMLIIGIGSIVLLGMAEGVLGSWRRTWRERVPGNFPTGATAN